MSPDPSRGILAKYCAVVNHIVVRVILLPITVTATKNGTNVNYPCGWGQVFMLNPHLGCGYALGRGLKLTSAL